jgi:nucleoside-diphosphate-sugar epimerase
MAARHASPACLTANGGAGEGFAVRDILKAIFDRSGVTTPLSFSGESRTGDPSRYIADVSIARGWGWAPQVGIEEGIGRYTDWFVSSSL